MYLLLWHHNYDVVLWSHHPSPRKTFNLCIVLSRIVASSLIVPPPLIFQPRCMLWYTQNSYFSNLKQHIFINEIQNMQFYHVICCFRWYLPYFYPIYEYKFNDLVFLTTAPFQKLVLVPGSTIRDLPFCLSLGTIRNHLDLPFCLSTCISVASYIWWLLCLCVVLRYNDK